ncbi:MAG: hypothetical protein FWG88_07865 [Oscillospiraceae bacterium]|nr:hypothetical protein [Oscillospiraceae bacterium]
MKKLFVFLIIIIIVGGIYSISILSTPKERYAITKPYDFESLKFEGWRGLSRVDQELLFQVPADIVNEMTTDALLQTFLNYPFAIDLIVCNTYQLGYYGLCHSFEALAILSTRDDLPKAIIEKYKYLNSTDIVSNDASGIESIVLIVLCTQVEIYSLFTNTDVANLLEVLSENDYSLLSAYIPFGQCESYEQLIPSIVPTKYDNTLPYDQRLNKAC